MATGVRAGLPCCEDQLCPTCELCGALQNLKVCARCKGAWYCSKEHQKTHWKEHKRSCNNNNIASVTVDPAGRGGVQGGGAIAVHSQNSCGEQCHSARTKTCFATEADKDCVKLEVVSNAGSKDSPTLTDTSSHKVEAEKLQLNSKRPQNIMNAVNCGGMSVGSAAGAAPRDSKPLGEYVVKCLNDYGLCVVDHFLGDEVCNKVLGEVQSMQNSGQLCDGELVNKVELEHARKVRGDKIAWAEKGDPGTQYLSVLMQRLDNLVMSCSKSFGRYVIGGRTKAMVACYPGSGTYYMRHVDNPNDDGRCITCIYYLNKNWDVQRDGGLLRIYPAQLKQVADIEPKFDRMLFFWSDRRNPHEVQPAYATRYAVTVWYFDREERLRARQRQLAGDEHVFRSGRNSYVIAQCAT